MFKLKNIWHQMKSKFKIFGTWATMILKAKIKISNDCTFMEVEVISNYFVSCKIINFCFGSYSFPYHETYHNIFSTSTRALIVLKLQSLSYNKIK